MPIRSHHLKCQSLQSGPLNKNRGGATSDVRPRKRLIENYFLRKVINPEIASQIPFYASSCRFPLRLL